MAVEQRCDEMIGSFAEARGLAERPWARWQKMFVIGLFFVLAYLAYSDMFLFLVVINAVSLFLFGTVILLKFLAVFLGLFHFFTVRVSEQALSDLDDASLPVYTILVPLYREGNVLEGLVDGLGRLDYPREKLDVKLLLEEDDEETRQAARVLDLPDYMEVLIVPDGTPRTKPRACNYGLDRARGEYLVVFDAEDRPDPDQLKKAVAGFRRLPEKVVCLQAQLDFYNSGQNLLTRCFTLEYAAWFRLYLPGLHALRSPIPLGGTSNHLKTDSLKRLGGWDAHNVTEDCDLGIRLARDRKSIRILDSTTWEEATEQTGPWLRQRSRWVKGYWQTLLVHTRSPFHAMRRLGLWRFFMMLNMVGGNVMLLLLLPLCWAGFIFWLGSDLPLFDPFRPWTSAFVVITTCLALSNLYFILIHFVAGIQQRRYFLSIYALAFPFYWLLMSFGGWYGLIHFFYAPFSWLKTPHGLLDASSTDRANIEKISLRARRKAHSSLLAFMLFALGFVLIINAAVHVPEVMGVQEKIEEAQELRHKDSLEGGVYIDTSWLGRREAEVALDLAAYQDWRGEEQKLNLSSKDLAAQFYLDVFDGERFAFEKKDLTIKEGRALLRIPLESGWKSVDGEVAWGPWMLRRVRNIELSLTGDLSHIASMLVKNVAAINSAPIGAFAVNDVEAPGQIACGRVFEARFDLPRQYDNPFDSQELTLDAEYIAPSGKTFRFPAFYTLDYDAEQAVAGKMVVEGEPYWAVRFMPRETGQYRWRIVGHDKSGETLETDWRTFEALEGEKRGYLQAQGEYFRFQNGYFHYPVPMNICYPRDKRVSYIDNYRPSPSSLGGLALYESFFDKMQDAGVNMGRIWMTSWWLGLEWDRGEPGYHGVGQYNLRNAWKMDYLLREAASRDLMIEIVLNHHGQFTEQYDSQWRYNPYNRLNGGMLRDHEDVMRNPEAIRKFKDRYRYCAARYGAYPNLFAWTMMIEVNVVNHDPRTRTRWHRDVGGYLGRIDGDRHPVSTEYNLTRSANESSTLKEIEYLQEANYNTYAFVSRTRKQINAMNGFGKPNMIEEYGGSWRENEAGHLSLQFHNAPWLCWNLPTSSAPMPWWWNFIFDNDLQKAWKPFTQYIRDEDLSVDDWHFFQRSVTNSRNLQAVGRVARDRAYAWVYLPDFVDNPNRAPHMFKDSGGSLFRTQKGTRLLLEGLESGDYTVEFWDTWQEGVVSRASLEVTGDSVEIHLPPLSKDIALKIKKNP